MVGKVGDKVLKFERKKSLSGKLVRLSVTLRLLLWHSFHFFFFFKFFFFNVLLNSQFYQLKKTFLSISVLLSFMCEPVVRASALPLIHPAEETSPRPRAQWSSVSLSETMQQQQRRRQDATRGRHCFSPDRGTLLFVARLQRERPAKGLWHPLPETSPHRVYFWQEMTQSWEKTTTVWIHRQLVNILLPCA